ncbi:MAG TPA: sulfurtransferase [Candidatus Limnocylindrales bacterium]
MNDAFPSPLVSAERLAELLVDPSARPRVRPVDVRWKLNAPEHGRLAFETGHVPGAIFLGLDTDLADPNGLGAPGRHPLPDPVAFARLLGDVGIGDDSYVVAYDDAGGTVAARLWWMLDDLGHREAAVLDGGIDAWVEAGGELTAEPADWPATALHVRGRWSRVVERDALRARLGEVRLVDGRAVERYRGDTEPVDPVAGHIPTAISAPVTANLENGRLLPPAELRRGYESLGLAAAGPEVVVACGSGVNATHHALSMRLAGLADPTLYAGSYSDWSRSGLPVATGDDPGDPEPAAR